MAGSKYTRGILEPIVRDATSIHGVLRGLGLKITGGSQSRIKLLLQEYEIDTSHFTGQAHRKGCSGLSKLPWQALLVKDRYKGARSHAHRLRRALIESGVPEVCAHCSLGPEWQGTHLRLQIDHKDGDFTNNLRENLQFLCPNCHSQTPSFGVQNSYWSSRGG